MKEEKPPLDVIVEDVDGEDEDGSERGPGVARVVDDAHSDLNNPQLINVKSRNTSNLDEIAQIDCVNHESSSTQKKIEKEESLLNISDSLLKSDENHDDKNDIDGHISDSLLKSEVNHDDRNDIDDQIDNILLVDDDELCPDIDHNENVDSLLETDQNENALKHLE